jgi:hypothetical protein
MTERIPSTSTLRMPRGSLGGAIEVLPEAI